MATTHAVTERMHSHDRPNQANGDSRHSKPSIPCPDPAAHKKDTQLQDHASKAALYVTAASERDARNQVDADARLSSASAATSLKYARPQDLPSFPIVGINKISSAGAAASLANANQKTFQHWKPDASADAGKAATLANELKMAPTWQPEISEAGSKAALLAHRDGSKQTLTKPAPNPDGNSAAGIAFRNKRTSPQPDVGVAENNRKWALQAATGSVRRKRAESTPATVASYPDAENASSNALRAATLVHKVKDSNRLGSDAMEAARIKNIGLALPREMYTERPPVEIEVEEARHNAALRGAAISFARQMYDVQSRTDPDSASPNHHATTAAARGAHTRAASVSNSQDLREQAKQYLHLQDVAQKIANEKLAKLEVSDNDKFRNYYGYEGLPSRSRLSIRGSRLRKRAASSDGAIGTWSNFSGDYGDSDDEERAHRIRSQTSQLNTGLAEIDARKRTADRVALIAAAEKRVQSQMHDLDEKVFNETGKVSPAMMEEWEAKARAKAAVESETRMQHHGKVHVGNGKFLEQFEIDAIARSRIQPTLDQINDTAEKQRAKDEERRLDEEQRRRELNIEKERERAGKAEEKRIKNEERAAEKSRKAEAKAAARSEKDAEKLRRREERETGNGERHHHHHFRRSWIHSSKTDDKTKDSPIADEKNSSDPPPPQTPVPKEDISTAPTVEPQTPSTDKALEARETDRPELTQRPSFMPSIERHISNIPSSSDSSVSSLYDVSDHEKPTLAASTSGDATTTATAAITTPASVPAPALTPTQSKKSVDFRGPEIIPDPPTSPSKRREGGGFKGLIEKLKSKKKREPGSLKSLLSPRQHDHDHDDQRTSSNPSSPRFNTATTSATPSSAAPDIRRQRRASDASSTSSFSSDDEKKRGRNTSRGRGSKAGTANGAATASQPVEVDEARDHFDEKLAPPPKFGAAKKKGESPVRTTMFHEEL